MIDSKKTGQLISTLRRKRGLTQKQLANMLFVTDKAVSKWERGLSIPDNSILSRLSVVLDCEIDDLLEHECSCEWSGLLDLSNSNVDVFDSINGQPIILLMLSYFLLVNITRIEIRYPNIERIKALKLERYNLNIFYEPTLHKRVLYINECHFLFGAGLTKLFRNVMNSNINTILCNGASNIPFVFSADGKLDFKNFEKKEIWRGFFSIGMDSKTALDEIRHLIDIYSHYSNYSAYNFIEIGRIRNIFSF